MAMEEDGEKSKHVKLMQSGVVSGFCWVWILFACLFSFCDAEK